MEEGDSLITEDGSDETVDEAASAGTEEEAESVEAADDAF